MGPGLPAKIQFFFNSGYVLQIWFFPNCKLEWFLVIFPNFIVRLKTNIFDLEHFFQTKTKMQLFFNFRQKFWGMPNNKSYQ
jgi:hypothetical protein